jgi:MoaA/NifB/PqqE/SkfB family radical SAM enzyme
MKYWSKVLSLKDILKSRVTGQRIPVAIRWQLTNRCSQKCIYCNIWQTPSDELTTDQIKQLLTEAAALGTRRISFSGGDPLCRKDFGLIVRHANSQGISCSINSNGSLIPKRLDAVKLLDLVKLSLDGPKQVHDSQKGAGSFDKAIQAAEILKREGVKFTFACTITKHNVDHLGFVLELAQEHNTLVAFQPLKELYRGVKDIEGIAPEHAKYQKAITALIDHKKAGNQHIRNSLRGLEHIFDWPDYKPLPCAAGVSFCMIEPDGRMTPCDRLGYDVPLPSAIEHGFKGALHRLPTPVCNGCGFCGALELNYVRALKFDILPMINRISS